MIWDALWAAVAPPAIAVVAASFLLRLGFPVSRPVLVYSYWLGDAAVLAVVYLSVALWLPAAVALGNAALAGWLLRRRMRRDRAPRSYGAKSLALLAELVRRLREAVRPRPVPQPVPGGAW